MKIKPIGKEDLGNINAVFLEAVLMPNGELIRFGMSLGLAKNKNGEGIYIKDESN